MNDQDLKQLLQEDPVPPLSSHFADRAMQRVQPSRLENRRAASWSLAGLGRVLGRRPAAVWRPWVWMLAAVALAWWAQTHVLQPVEDELFKIDTLGMASLLLL